VERQEEEKKTKQQRLKYFNCTLITISVQHLYSISSEMIGRQAWCGDNVVIALIEEFNLEQAETSAAI
jgi:hypothetical protein